MLFELSELSELSDAMKFTATPFRRLMAVLSCSTLNELRQQVKFLKAENEELRRKLPSRLQTISAISRSTVRRLLRNAGHRRVFVSPAAVAPTESWVAQETSVFLDTIEQGGDRAKMLIRDRNTKVGSMFDAVHEDHGTKALVLPPRSPNLNAYVERVTQTLRRECPDHFIIHGCRHLNGLMCEYIAHCNRERPHSSLEHRTPSGPPTLVVATKGETRVIDHARLGGLFHHCRQRAAQLRRHRSRPAQRAHRRVRPIEAHAEFCEILHRRCNMTGQNRTQCSSPLHLRRCATVPYIRHHGGRSRGDRWSSRVNANTPICQ